MVYKYPDEVAKLLIYILNSGAHIERIEFTIQEVVEKINCTDERLKTKLNEALLLRHITLTCN